jgi:hypothetical protein
MGMFDFTAGGNNAVVYLDPATGNQLSAPPAAK